MYLWLQCKPTTQALAKEHKVRAKKAAQSKAEQEKQAEADAASPEQDAELDAIFWGVVGPAPAPPEPAAGGRRGRRPTGRADGTGSGEGRCWVRVYI